MNREREAVVNTLSLSQKNKLFGSYGHILIDADLQHVKICTPSLPSWGNNSPRKTPISSCRIFITYSWGPGGLVTTESLFSLFLDIF
jgi:hypothetical protein